MHGNTVLRTAVIPAALSLLLTTGQAYYQGVVRDSVSATALDSVLVKLKGTGTQVYTDSQGRFTIGSSPVLSAGTPKNPSLPLRFDPFSNCLVWDGNDVASFMIYNVQGMVVVESGYRGGAGSYAIPQLADGMYILDINIDGMMGREKMVVADNTVILDLPSRTSSPGAAKAAADADTLLFSKPRARTLPGGYTPTMPGYTDRQLAVTAGDTDLAVKLYGWPNSYNTGYRNAPGYTGSLTAFSGTIGSNQTYRNRYFRGGASLSSSLSNVTFIGCRFSGLRAADSWTITDVAADNTTFDYCSFEPEFAATPPVGNADSPQFGIWQRSACKVTIDHCDFWGWANGIQLVASSQSKPFVVRNSWFHDARADGGSDHTDAILENWGGTVVQYMVFDHNTIVSKGNTNGLALQGENYTHVTGTNNYFSGFGYTVSFGHGTNNQYMVFTDNVFGTDLQCGLVCGPLYSWCSGTGNQWARNTWHVVPGAVWQITPQLPAYCTAPASDGKYWWPNPCYDQCVRNTDYTGN